MTQRKKTSPVPLRTLKSSQQVPEAEKTIKLAIETNCPRKWLFVDLETGQVWSKRTAYGNWNKIGRVDSATPQAVVILPLASAAIPQFDL